MTTGVLILAMVGCFATGLRTQGYVLGALVLLCLLLLWPGR